MDGDRRRAKIMELLETGKEPVSGSALSKILGVSRQVIVQDIALLRATNKNILSTNKGYVLFGGEESKKMVRRVLCVCHTDEEMREELYTVVDCGAKVTDVIVEHDIYGQIAVDLSITSRKDVDEFMDKILIEQAKPLKLLTENVHFHTIEAESEEILDVVQRKLKDRHYLISS